MRLVSITQELGDDPMSNMIRQIMALFDEYQSKENAKHTLRAMKENARQGFWNGSLPPIGYRIVEATEQRGHRIKKTLKIDPIQAETVAQRVEVDAKEVRIMGSKSVLLRTLVAASSAKRRVLECPVLCRSGALGGIRTPDPQIRSLLLYRSATIITITITY